MDKDQLMQSILSGLSELQGKELQPDQVELLRTIDEHVWDLLDYVNEPTIS